MTFLEFVIQALVSLFPIAASKSLRSGFTTGVVGNGVGVREAVDISLGFV
jgi:hypothetical protein